MVALKAMRCEATDNLIRNRSLSGAQSRKENFHFKTVLDHEHCWLLMWDRFSALFIKIKVDETYAWCFWCCNLAVRWNVSVGTSYGGRKHFEQFRTRLIFCGWKARLANQRRCERGRLTSRRSNKNCCSSIRTSSSFVCLYCSKYKISSTAARTNKSSSLSEL